MASISAFGSLLVALELPNFWGENRIFFPELLLAETYTFLFGNSH